MPCPALIHPALIHPALTPPHPPSPPACPLAQKALGDAGISPSDTRTYTPQQLTEAVRKATGATPILVCFKDFHRGKWLLEEVRMCVGKDMHVSGEPGEAGMGLAGLAVRGSGPHVCAQGLHVGSQWAREKRGRVGRVWSGVP